MIIQAMIYARERTKIEPELWERRAAAAAIQRQRAEQYQQSHAPAEPDPVTRVLDADFWASDEAPTVRLPL